MDERRLCRPGGFRLTRQLCGWIEERERALHVVDIGCGDGASLGFLAEEYPKWSFLGFDPALKEAEEKKSEAEDWPIGTVQCFRASADKIPLADSCVDVVLMECSLSRMENPDRTLTEIRRILRPEGRLLISDLYSRAESGSEMPVEDMKTIDCRIGRLETAEQIRERLRRFGLRVFEMEDRTKVLGDWVAQKIMDGCSCEMAELLGIDPAELRRRKPGYYLLAAEADPVPGLIRMVSENSEYYRKRYAGETDFEKLPMMGASDLRQDPEQLVCVPTKEIARIITLKSSGSTGKPKRIFFTEEDLESTADFFSVGIRWLVRPGDRVAVFMEGPTHYSVGGLLKEGLSRLPAEVTVYGLIRDYEKAADQARGMDSIVGVPAQIYRLARLAPDLRPRTVLLSADNVSEAVKQAVEDAWQCTVFTHWGMSETGYGGGVQCSARQGYHLRNRHLLTEILDPETLRPVEPGQVGELVITTLHRRGMPLIRYRTGDLTYMMNGTCPCGCMMPRLGPIVGRKDGGIRLPDGKTLRLPMLDELVYPLPILGYQAEWNSETEKLRIHLLKDDPSSNPEICRQLIDSIRETFGCSFTVDVDLEYNREDYGLRKRRVVGGEAPQTGECLC